jgi:alpha-1,6-mannosyltransferase
MKLDGRTIPGAGEMIAGLIFLCSVFGLGYLVEQTEFLAILTFWLPCAVVFAVLLYKLKTGHFTFWLLIGILSRFILLFPIPNLSDDIYRFYWDGILWTHGINPLEHVPSYFMQPGNQLDGLTVELYEKLNSPEYFTIYPPVLQFLFGTGAFVSTGIFGFSVFLKVVLLIFELVSMYIMARILQQIQVPKEQLLIYAVNPLVIVEIAGNIHFEGAMIFFLALGIFFLFTGKILKGAGGFAGSVGSKLLPLMFFPATIRFLGWKKGLIWAVLAMSIFVLLSVPFLNMNLFHNFLQSFDLYFRKFEFNASIYYLARSIGSLFTGYNQIAIIGPLLGFLAFSGIISIAWFLQKGNKKRYLHALFFSFVLYLLCSATVHPWYLLVPVFLSVFVPFRFAVIWSLTVVLSYSHYQEDLFQENYLLIGLEYLLPAIYFWWEVSKKSPDEVEHYTD